MNENFQIEMVPVTDTYMPEVEGRYLARTISSSSLKSVCYIYIRVYKYQTERGVWKWKADINNQTISHISKTVLS